MLLKILAALTGLLLLCSCNMAAISGTESLLVAPKLNKRQAEVSQALEAALSLRVIYKYPQSGEYRSPFIFYDFNGDGEDEAIVFYSYSNEASSTVRAKILILNGDGTWTPFYDISSMSGQVDFVQFEKLFKDKPDCMIIGWKGAGRQSSVLEVYSMYDGDFKPEAGITYSRYSIRDFDGDGLAEIVVISQNGLRGNFNASLLRADGDHVESGESLALSSETESVMSLTNGRLWDGSGAIYIDEMLAGGTVTTTATEIIRVSSEGLTMLCGGEGTPRGEFENPVRSLYEITFRDEDIVCMDFDLDGIVEVPHPVSLPGLYESADPGIPKLIQFMHLTPEGFDIQKSAVINSEAGYLVYFPDYWKDRVIVEREQENSEWRFRKWNPDTLESAEELLRIRVSSTKDYLDMFEEYTELAARGTTSYTAYIPKIPNEALAVTEREVKEMFSLLPS